MLTLFKRSFKILLFSLLCSGCDNSDQNHKPAAKKIINIGHAGSGFNYLFMPFNPYPPNSFQSLKNGLNDGAEGVEVDVQITSDHVLVLFHDNTLESRTELSGFMINANSKDVLGVSYECGFPYDLIQDEHIITFHQWLEYSIKLPVIPYLHIDLKTSNGQSDAIVDTLLKLVFGELNSVNYPLDKVIVISGESTVITKILNNYPAINTAYQPAEFSEGLKWILANGVEYIIMDQKRLTPEDIQAAHEKGIGVIALGGRAKSTFRKLIDMKPDYIQSNNVSLLHKLLK